MSANTRNGTADDAEHLNGPISFQSVVPKERQELLKWNGWGYKDSEFRVNENTVLEFTGTRYPIGSKELPYFSKWVQDILDVDLEKKIESQSIPQNFPEPVISLEFLGAIQELKIEYSTKGVDRLIRAHGHTLREIFTLKHGILKRIPDIVLWPKCHEDVVRIIKVCARYGTVCIPFGGGTSVSGAASCPTDERRTIALLDTSQMNRILWIDRENLMACCESGIIGQDLEKQLRLQGLTSGHEPDSYEFSRKRLIQELILEPFRNRYWETKWRRGLDFSAVVNSLGGWVATRASGMKKNRYGNIEDLVVRVRMVTGRTEDPELTLERGILVPRASCGPDFDHIILGSEGTLGVVTEVVLKIRPIPKVVKYGSIVFPNFQAGVMALRQVAKERCQPASVRLMDNEQFQFGQVLRPETGWGSLLLQGLKQAYITRIKGFKWDQICVVTLLFEGDAAADVAAQEQKMYNIAKQHSGIPAGETNGERGYVLTFVIAYIRDLGLDYYILAESFETSVSWNRALPLCRNVKSRVARECYKHGIEKHFISCRITQTYDEGCCVYFYMAFNYSSLSDPVDTYEAIEHAAREEILANGGSLSHHHGVGKLRACFYSDAVGEAGVSLYRAAKAHLDPHNIFAAGNLDPSCVSKL